jgi:enamine deaminase RidA (YjgF/YER057c/UK114 family)
MSLANDQPIPQGKYLPAVRHADVIYTSGMTPRKAGKLMYLGAIKIGDPLEAHREAVILAVSNALTAAKACLGEGEKLVLILQLNVFLNAEQGYKLHSKLADYASEFLMEQLGAGCIGSRAAIGVASLPSDAPVEITLVGKVG